MEIQVQFMDDSWSLNQIKPMNKEFIIIPSYRPIKWIIYSNDDHTTCQYKYPTLEKYEPNGGDSDSNLWNECEETCRFQYRELNEGNTMMIDFPRQLAKPTYEFFLTAQVKPVKNNIN
jgi:hypothetical protein